jgi:hypothetical protein
MKMKIKFPEYLFSLLLILTMMLPSQVKAQYEDVSLETFYDELSPYGVWINDPQYGYVWRPDVDQDDFRPYYSNGHWEMTRYGNTWVSDYDWGWAPFHYGRWQHSSRRGWIWIPDTKWGPAWVSWRSGGGHYGWAPLGPGINININIGPRIPDYYWVFVPQRSIYYSRFPSYDRRRNINIYNNTVIINNTYVYNRNRYYTGPRAEEIRRVTRQPVRINEVRDNRPQGYANGNNRPEVYRNSDRSGGSTVNSPRPQRPSDNGAGRGATTGRDGGSITEKPNGQGAVRPDARQIPASSQRSERTYDNQDIRGNQNRQNGQAGPITERQQQAPRESQASPVSREQRPARTEQAQAPRQVQAPERVQRSSGQESRPAPSQNSRVQRDEPSRGNATSNAERSSRNEGRPGRVQ